MTRRGWAAILFILHTREREAREATQARIEARARELAVNLYLNAMVAQ